MKNKEIMYANESSRLRCVFLPQIGGAQDPGVLLMIVPNASDGAYKASCHNF